MLEEYMRRRAAQQNAGRMASIMAARQVPQCMRTLAE